MRISWPAWEGWTQSRCIRSSTAVEKVRQDLVMLRARDALVAARTEIINPTRGLVKSMGTRLPKGSSRSFAPKGEETVPVEVREALLPWVGLAATLSADIQGVRQKD
jgi:hypothetical protein